MTLLAAIGKRHSVRNYTDQKIEGEILSSLLQYIDDCNHESGLHIQLVLDDSAAFTGFLAHYGKLRNVRNYLALVGKKDSLLEEKCGYYGEKIVLYAQTLGLNTCWIGGTYKKSNVPLTIAKGEKLLMIIAIGYGVDQGQPHRSKPLDKLSGIHEHTPAWFIEAMKAVQLAPTALNQQKFYFSLNNNIVEATAGRGFYTKTDLGIAKYHFELAASTTEWQWK